MTFVLFAAVVVLFVWHEWDRSRHQGRHDQATTSLMAAHQEHIQGLLAQKNPDLEQLIGLVGDLCQRVQAPEQAVIDHSFKEQPLTMPPVISMDDDEGFRETKEQLADRLAMAEVAA